jgi:hypothetical protein
MTAMPLRLGPLCFCAGVALYRAVWLSTQLSGLNPSELGYLLLADIPVLGIVGLLAFFEGVAARPWRPLFLLLTAFLVTVYLADVATVIALNSRLQLSDIRLFGREWWLARSFVRPSTIAIALVVLASFAIRPSVPVRVARFLPGAALVLALLPLVVGEQRTPSHLQKYAGSVLLLGKELWGARRPPISRYRGGDFAAYRSDYEALFEAPFAQTRKNVVLVIVESLSAVDSRRTSGIRNLLPRFDALSREGMLFRNFFANFEASEGGIVSLLSGVPPMHFPTASTNTFGEYALQRSIAGTFDRSGYHSEFVTTVPMQFISMDAYARSPLLGFDVAGGQLEIGGFRDSRKFAFQSPADHVLYEELLAHLDARRREDPPVLIAAITASSHPPYVDPLARANTEEQVWGYVQDELWWFYSELQRRGFFENGLLIVTGDHRRMAPIHEAERERYGESAKARIPLMIIGAGVPKDVVDDRLFQQSDLLRMLDRAIRPDVPLSPFAVWVERYVFVYGVASNASNLEVFEASNQARQGFRLNLRGAEIDWITRPPDAIAIERAVHRQRALQQANRAASLTHASINFGRELKPSNGNHGMLIGLSSDVNLGRDPDDTHGSLETMTAGVLDPTQLLQLARRSDEAFTMSARAFLPVPQDGDYWFSIFADEESCLAIDKQAVLGCQRGLNEGVAFLTAGVHRFDLRYIDRGRNRILKLNWLPPGSKTFTPLPLQALILPQTRH